MSDVTQAEAPIEVVQTGGDETFTSPASAARALAEFRWKQQQPKEQESATPAAPEVESETAPAVEDAAPQEEVTGETQEAEPETPTIEPPRSWSKEARERWSKLDPDTQNYLLERDRQDSTAVRQAQNEAAEHRKAVEAERAALEQVRQQYEQSLPVLAQMLQSQMAGEFADVQTQNDVDRMAREDPARYTVWRAQQDKLMAIQAQQMQIQQASQQEYAQRWQQYALEQDKAFLEAVPEFADKERGQKLAQQSKDLLRSAGFKDEELQASWNGQAPLYMRDARVQQIILKAAKYDAAQAAAKKAAAKPVPPVQRPGTAGARVSAADAEIQALQQRFEKTGSLKDAQALRAAQTAAARRKAS